MTKPKKIFYRVTEEGAEIKIGEQVRKVPKGKEIKLFYFNDIYAICESKGKSATCILRQEHNGRVWPMGTTTSQKFVEYGEREAMTL